jgi:hypothetical protein
VKEAIVQKIEMFREGLLPVTRQYPAPGWTLSGPCRATFADPVGLPLWLCRAQVGPGVTLSVGRVHEDQALYVVSGTLRAGGQECSSGGAVILESGAGATVEITSEAELVHVGSVGPPAEPPQAAPLVHVVGARGWFRSGKREAVDATWFADGTCPSCRIAFFSVARGAAAAKRGPMHSHSQPEIIHVLEGKVWLGARDLGPGSSLCIRADVRYTLTIDEGGARFLNYRPGKSEQTYFGPGAATRTEAEGGLARGGIQVDDLVSVKG